MNVLLTGSSGWLGHHLAPRLLAAGHGVVGLDLAPGPHTQIVASVADRAAIRAAFTAHAVEAVVHTAPLHEPHLVHHDKGTFVEVNELGTLHLLEAAVAAGHDRFVFTSTISLMIRAGRAGGATEAYWLDETFGPLRPRNV